MLPFDECCVLIPAATLEDFPADLSDYDARSLLAAWTVLWHPTLLAATAEVPTWCRADSPPDPRPRQLILLPSPSADQLPPDFPARVEATEGCSLVRAAGRDEFLDQIAAFPAADASAAPGAAAWKRPPALTGRHRSLEVADFYAAGYAYLQIQVMTRRLRYTSNLDEIFLQKQLITAAKCFGDRQADEAITALHDVFDLLAQERDHYFSSSDPHLIDLTLVTASTLDRLLPHVETDSQAPTGSDAGHTCLPTPKNYLLDQEVCEAFLHAAAEDQQRLRRALARGAIGWAGGGPDPATCLDTLTLDQALTAVTEATASTQRALQQAPTVLGRYTGGWPGDLNGALVNLGYAGLIPIDFASGTGFGDEAKVILESGGAKLEGLTAKPLDAGSDAAFLTFAPRLGEAIDSGEIATALLVHWPGHGCDSFQDVRRAASWSLCLGRFWTLQEYFSEGEHPYHHGTAPAATKSAATWLESLGDRNVSDPLSSLAGTFRQAVLAEHEALIEALADLVHTQPSPAATAPAASVGPERQPSAPLAKFAAVVTGGQPGPTTGSTTTLVVNPLSSGCRVAVETAAAIDRGPRHIFAVTPRGSQFDVTVDLPSCGFVVLGQDRQDVSSGRALSQRWGGRWWGSRRRGREIAEAVRGDRSWRLQNEFLEAVISGDSGGVAGVYSGPVRGNRFSLKLVHHRDPPADPPVESVMRCEELKLVASSAAEGCLEARGVIADATADQVLADFRLSYRLQRGSRLLRLRGRIAPRQPLSGRPWQHYLAARAAVAGEAAIYRPLIRDKIHRSVSRRMIAPLGVLIDESERQTLVAAHGMAAHRQVGDRFLDTLLVVPHQRAIDFELAYGFDTPAPVAAARASIAPPAQMDLRLDRHVAPLGWLLHTAPGSVLVNRLTVGQRPDGRRAAVVRMVQTRSQPASAAIRFPYDVDAALALIGPAEQPLQTPIPESGQRRLKVQGDRVTVPLAAHAVVEILVVFKS